MLTLGLPNLQDRMNVCFHGLLLPLQKVKKQNIIVCKTDLQGDSGPLCPSSSALHVTLHVTPAPPPCRTSGSSNPLPQLATGGWRSSGPHSLSPWSHAVRSG